MKQKITIKVQMTCDKCRSNALSIAAMASGVISVGLEGEERNNVVVIGEGVDAASLTESLRKKIGKASLESVKEVEQVKKKVEEKKDIKTENGGGGQGIEPILTPWTTNYTTQFEVYEVVRDPDPPGCTIM